MNKDWWKAELFVITGRGGKWTTPLFWWALISYNFCLCWSGHWNEQKCKSGVNDNSVVRVGTAKQV